MFLQSAFRRARVRDEMRRALGPYNELSSGRWGRCDCLLAYS